MPFPRQWIVFLVLTASVAIAADNPDLVSLHLRDASLLRVIEVLVHERGVNIVAPPGLDRKVTVRLHDVPWRTALDLILKEHGYGVEQVGNILRIDTLENLKERPRRVEVTARHLQRGELESLARSVVPTGPVSVLEPPSPPGRARSRTVVVQATGEQRKKLGELVARFDRAPKTRELEVLEEPCHTLSVQGDDIEVAQAIDDLTQSLGLNVTWESPPRGRATVHLEHASLRAALAAILEPVGYAFDISENMVRIGERRFFEARPETRVYQLSYANAVHVRSAIQQMLSKDGKVEVVGEVRRRQDEPAGAAPGPTPPPGSVVQAGGAAVVYPGLRVSRSSTATFAQPTAPPSDRIVVTDTPATLNRVDQLVCELDRPPEQVEIETQLLEVVLTREQQLGIRWNIEANANGASGNIIRFPLGKDAVNAANVAPNFTLGVLSATNFTLMLKALSHHNDLKTLSSPRIATLSNEPARILIGQRFPITTQGVSQQTNFTTVGLDYFEDVGIVLTVTPRVVNHDTVHLVIKPQVSSITSLIDSRFPVIDTREAESQLMVRSGYTALIGGLVQDRAEKDEEGVPGLAHLGALGHLFGLKKKSKKRTELLVCVTPHILDTPTGRPPRCCPPPDCAAAACGAPPITGKKAPAAASR